MNNPEEKTNPITLYFEFLEPSVFVKCQNEIEKLNETGGLVDGEIRRIDYEIGEKVGIRLGTDFTIKCLQAEGLKRYTIILDNYRTLDKGIKLV